MNMYSKELRKQVYEERLKNGTSYSELARMFEIGNATAKRFCKNPEGTQRKYLTDAEKAEIKIVYALTQTNYQALAEQFGVTKEAIKYVCKKDLHVVTSSADKLAGLYIKQKKFNDYKNQITAGMSLKLHNDVVNVTNVTDSLIIFKYPTGRTSSIQWNEIFCGAVKPLIA